MALPKERIYTIEDIYNLPEGTRAELIDGQIYYMAPPSRQHQKIIGELYTNINNYIRGNKGTCEAYTTPFAVYLNENSDTYIEPDISVICDKGKLDDKGCKGSPDLIIEVVSPGNPEHDYITKLGMYRAAGVREYWIVDPRNQTTKVYFFEAGIFAQNYTFSDTIKVNIYSDLSIDFSQLNI
ncbi:MAG: Uma2 family endonuclease [Eubacteriales bacterium]|nr:Uma2 family endonuclease [Eubacteriales bacterium]